MNPDYLEFEQPIVELEAKIDELRLVESDNEFNLNEEITKLQAKSEGLIESIFSNLTPWQVAQLARHSKRPYTLDYIERIFAKDSFLGNVRNHASEKIPLKDALNNYTSELESLDYTNCPENFISAFQDHINAWKKVAEISSKYPSLRGELHDIFLQLEKSKDSIEFKSLVKQVWDTWSKVEESASNQS